MDADAEGLEVHHPEKKMGLRGSPTHAISYDRVRVPLGNLLGQWGVSTGEEGPRVEGQLHFADGITVDGQGNIYVGDWAGGHSYVTKFVTP